MNYTFADLKKYCAENGLIIATMPGTDQLHFYEFGEIPNIEKTMAKHFCFANLVINLFH